MWKSKVLMMLVFIICCLQGFNASAGKYPVKKDSVNPDYENGQLWDREYIGNEKNGHLNWCKQVKEMYPDIKVTIDWASFEQGFDYEMTHYKKVIDRHGAIVPHNPCDRFCAVATFDTNTLMGDKFPSSQTTGVVDEFKQKVKNLVCRYKNPGKHGEGETHVEYDPKSKTLTGIFTYSDNTNWSGTSWYTKAFTSGTFKSAFPKVNAWIDSH